MRTDRERLGDAIEAIDRCLSQAERGREAFEADPLVQVWMVHHLEILGEACRSVTAHVRAAHPDVPWAAIVGMRSILVHDYFGIDLAEVWSTVERDLPPLRARLEAVVASVHEPPSARIGPSRSLRSVHRDHQDRSIAITEIGIVITQIGPS